MDRWLTDLATGLQVLGAGLFQFIIFGISSHQLEISLGALLLAAGGLLHLARNWRVAL